MNTFSYDPTVVPLVCSTTSLTPASAAEDPSDTKYNACAVATDNVGGSTTSAPTNIVVTGTSLVNLALASNGAVATASSVYNSDYGPAGAINGDRKGLSWGSGGGWNDATAGNFPDWLEVDFNAINSIQEIDVFTVQDAVATPTDPNRVGWPTLAINETMQVTER